MDREIANPDEPKTEKQRKAEEDLEVKQLYDIHYKSLYRLAKYKLSGKGSAHDAEDCVQEAIGQLWKNRREGIVIKDVTAWLYRVTSNIAAGRLRELIKQNSQVTYFEDSNIDFDQDERYAREDEYCFFTEEQKNDAEIEILRQQILPVLLSTLTELDQAIFHDYFVENMPVKTIAEKYGLSANAANQRVFRVRCRIKAAYKAQKKDFFKEL